MIVSVDGINLYVERRGAGSPAFVFLHHWEGSLRTGRHLVDRLAPVLQTVAIDQRGWGRSDAPPAGHALADLVDDAMAVITALDLEQYILLGHSMGGEIGRLAPRAARTGLSASR